MITEEYLVMVAVLQMLQKHPCSIDGSLHCVARNHDLVTNNRIAVVFKKKPLQKSFAFIAVGITDQDFKITNRAVIGLGAELIAIHICYLHLNLQSLIDDQLRIEFFINESVFRNISCFNLSVSIGAGRNDLLGSGYVRCGDVRRGDVRCGCSRCGCSRRRFLIAFGVASDQKEALQKHKKR